MSTKQAKPGQNEEGEGVFKVYELKVRRGRSAKKEKKMVECIR